MDSQHKWLAIFIFNYLIYSYLVGRANLLIKLLNACTEQQTNTTLNARLPSVFEEVFIMPHRFLLESGHSSGFQWNPEELKMAEGPANIAIPGSVYSSGIQAFWN